MRTVRLFAAVGLATAAIAAALYYVRPTGIRAQARPPGGRVSQCAAHAQSPFNSRPAYRRALEPTADQRGRGARARLRPPA